MEKFKEDTVKIGRSGYHADDAGRTDGGITVVVGKANVYVIFCSGKDDDDRVRFF